ncbi:MAG: prolyl oligopeptidase family serine peptidase, partial [Nanoarchaeota archaeon]|nr:prolyl oligopeptidase family serine peptidase [Nanoarchaeota archaeon]
RKGWKDHQNKIYGGSIKEKKKRSALFWTDKLPKKTPILLLHGTSDWKVNPLDSINMAEKLYQNKIPYRLVIYEGDDHGMSNNKQDYQKQVLDWFKRFLIDNEKLPDMKPHGR